MSREDEVWWPGDRELVDGALAEARHTGVPESEIQRILRHAASGPQDGFTVPILAGRLAYASQSRLRSTRRPSGPSIFTGALKTLQDDDDW